MAAVAPPPLPGAPARSPYIGSTPQPANPAQDAANARAAAMLESQLRQAWADHLKQQSQNQALLNGSRIGNPNAPGGPPPLGPTDPNAPQPDYASLNAAAGYGVAPAPTGGGGGGVGGGGGGAPAYVDPYAAQYAAFQGAYTNAGSAIDALRSQYAANLGLYNQDTQNQAQTAQQGISNSLQGAQSAIAGQQAHTQGDLASQGFNPGILGPQGVSQYGTVTAQGSLQNALSQRLAQVQGQQGDQNLAALNLANMGAKQNLEASKAAGEVQFADKRAAAKAAYAKAASSGSGGGSKPMTAYQAAQLDLAQQKFAFAQQQSGNKASATDIANQKLAGIAFGGQNLTTIAQGLADPNSGVNPNSLYQALIGQNYSPSQAMSATQGILQLAGTVDVNGIASQNAKAAAEAKMTNQGQAAAAAAAKALKKVKP